MDRLGGTIFKVFIFVALELGPKKFTTKEITFQKIPQKIFTRLYFSKYPFIPTNPLLAAMSFLNFFFQNTVRLISERHSTEKNPAVSNVLLRRTNNANKIRDISPKKFWLLSWTSQRLQEINTPVSLGGGTPKLCQNICLLNIY